jgi:hypothetical protein
MKFVSISFVAITMIGCGSSGKRSLPHDTLNQCEDTSESELKEYAKIYGSLSTQDCINKFDAELAEIMKSRDGLTNLGNQAVDTIISEFPGGASKFRSISAELNCKAMKIRHDQLTLNDTQAKVQGN